ncbi:MAG: alpha/beta fold hydrolase [Candidatus Promineifilaceae bacterium]
MTQFADNEGIQIAYETLGSPNNETIIFISGLGSQLVYWTDALCQVFLDRDFHVIRFDSRDMGLSSKTPGQPPSNEVIISGEVPAAPYTLSDMAADTVAVLDAVGVAQAHVVGNSLGGMIAQTVAIEYPERVRSLTSVMSAASRVAALPDDDGSSAEIDEEQVAAREASVTVDVHNPETYVDLQVEGYRVTSGPHFDADYQRGILQQSFDRCYHPNGWAFQMLAAVASGDRTPMLAKLQMPALVIHGALDPLIPPKAGKETADAIPNAKWLLIEEMGHNWPRPCWVQIADAITEIARGGDK